MKLLVIDNYDSFTFNLVQYLGELGAQSDVVRNDAIGAEDVGERSADAVVISPGPCTPREAGISVDAVRSWAGRLPILGVCLGHQSIGQAYGGRVVRAPKLMHGKLSQIRHRGKGVFMGINGAFSATRYHSLTIAPDSLGEDLEITADAGGVIMGLIGTGAV